MPSGTPNINLNYLAWAAEGPRRLGASLQLFIYLFICIDLFIYLLMNFSTSGIWSVGVIRELND